MTRSIGTGFSMSALTPLMAVSWSTVPVKPKASLHLGLLGVSGAKACPGAACRLA